MHSDVLTMKLPRRRLPTRSDHSQLRFAVVGYGYWGPNLVRNVMERPDLDLRVLCERDPSRGAAFRSKHGDVAVSADLDRVLADPSIDAVIVATPPSTHYPIVRDALLAGKHVLVEKPLAKTAAEAADLIRIADDAGLVLMPGHTFVYSPAVNAVRDLVREGTVGDVYFVTSSRLNLGKYQADGVVCDLAPHDLSILMYWLEQPVREVSASACSVFQDGVPETAFMTLTFEGGTTANIQVSWLAPRKVRHMVVVGSQRMVQYDDTAADEPVRVYDRGMDFAQPESFGEHQLTYRAGDVLIPRIEAAEPLSLEIQDFAQAIRTGRTPRSSAQLGLQIVETLDAINTSLRRNGAPVELASSAKPVAA